ncbi:MAG: hypothetical protein ACTHJT_14165 [Cytophaga sp.]|uniref:hypothetical protein n=1 Tax=Cytophaga sp. TaxID=29535 RepID=UPI003F7FC153
MKKITLFFFLAVTYFTAWSQSIPPLDSLLRVPGLYLIAYPDDGPKEALKGLKPLFCKDQAVISTFFHAMELKPDTSCTGNAYYNYIIHFSSDHEPLDWVGLCFNKKQKDDTPTLNNGKDEYYSFNPKSLSYLKDHSTVIKEQTYTCMTLQKSREFYSFLKQTPETYFYSDIRNDVYTKYNGAVLLQFEYADTLRFEEGEKYIQERIKTISSSTDYYYHLREANWHKPGFTTEKILLHINQENLLPGAASYTIQPWSSYGSITFRVYSNQSKTIETYFKK